MSKEIGTMKVYGKLLALKDWEILTDIDDITDVEASEYVNNQTLLKAAYEELNDGIEVDINVGEVTYVKLRYRRNDSIYGVGEQWSEDGVMYQWVNVKVLKEAKLIP